MSECTEALFLKDVAEHQLTILRDDEHGRHIRLKRPGTGCYYFDLITWPECLCYTGDMGTFVFTRLPDMFQFFRQAQGKSPWPRGNTMLSINPGYWSEKLIATTRNGGHEEIDADYIASSLKADVREWMREHRGDTTKEQRRELAEDLEWNVFKEDRGEQQLRAASGYSFKVNPRAQFSFSEVWDRDYTKFTFHFIWACYAITWGIKQYDAARADQANLAEVTA